MEKPATIPAHSSHVASVTLAPNGQIFVSAGMDNEVKLWTVSSWKLARTLEGHEKSVNSLSFSPDGRWLAMTAADKKVRAWDLA
jgi:WD40 repeat protein